MRNGPPGERRGSSFIPHPSAFILKVALPLPRALSAVDLAPVADGQRENDHSSILDLADNPEVADAVPPQAGHIAFQRLAQVTRVLATLDAVVEPVEDAPCNLPVELPQLLLSERGNLNGPGQALS